ncbi:hypothetical protein MBLNU459_g1821t1 [Dothideomycetes sp. NU459]
MSSAVVKATIQAAVLSAISNVLAQLLSCYQAGKPYAIDPEPLVRFVVFSLFSCPPNYLWQSWLESNFPGYTDPTEAGTTTSIAQSPMVQSLSEKTAPATKSLSDKANAASTALSDNDIVQTVKRRATEGIETVKAKAKEIETRSGMTVNYTATAKGNSISRAQTFSTADGQVIERDTASKAEPPAGKDAIPKKKLNVKNTAIKFALDQTLGAVFNNVLFTAGMGALRGLPVDKIITNVQTDFLPLLFAGQKLWPAVSIISFTMVPLEHRTVFGGIVGIGWGIFLSLLAGGKK